jgi:hypothetical protein
MLTTKYAEYTNATKIIFAFFVCFVVYNSDPGAQSALVSSSFRICWQTERGGAGL